MKSIITIIGFMLILMIYAPAATAIPLSTVGGGDLLVDWADLGNSGTTSEIQFIADYLSVDASTISYSQLTGSDGSAWMEVTDDGSDDLWAFDFSGYDPLLFLIKTGSGVGLDDAIDGGSADLYNHFLYQNISSLQYGVINLNDFVRDHGSVEIGMVSHVGTSGESRVPEPSTMILLGGGLTGLAFFRNRFKK